MSSEQEIQFPWPRTLWERLYVGWFLVCFLAVYLGTWAVNEPTAVFGFPLVYVWCTVWGLAWQTGCLIFGLKMERDLESEQGA
jgi:hypothetical protein